MNSKQYPKPQMIDTYEKRIKETFSKKNPYLENAEKTRNFIVRTQSTIESRCNFALESAPTQKDTLRKRHVSYANRHVKSDNKASL